MKNLIRLLVIPFFFFAFVSCDDDDDNNDEPTTTTFTAALNGASEVPANVSTATGTATAIYNNDTNKLSISVPFTGVTATAAHIHKAAIGASGPAVFPFTDLTSPLTLTEVTLTSEQEADLMNEMYYVNIHSAAFPDGEIRGQLLQN